MTRDDIIQLAQHAGFGMPVQVFQFTIEELERFAALVAAEKEQQMISNGWRKCAEGQRTTQFCGLLDAAVKAEREACAKVCEEIPLPADSESLTHLPTIERCAAAIRERGEV